MRHSPDSHKAARAHRRGAVKAQRGGAQPSGAPEGCGGRVYLAVAALACSCYVNALHGDFVHDDIPAVTRNRDVVGGGALVDVFRDDFWGTPMWDAASHKSYRPLTTLTFRATYAAAGLAPSWFHAANVLLHAAASLLFTRVCRAVAGLSPRFAAVAGLLFAAHPVHTEAVTGIVGRADVLACVFFLLSFLAYHGGDPVDGHIWLSVVFGGVSMLAKETGITVLVVNLLYDFYRSWHSIKRSLLEVRWNDDTQQFARRAAKILMSLSVLLVFRLAMLQGSLPRFSNQDNPAAFHPSRLVRFLTFCYLAAFNCWLLLCPATLSHDWQMGSVPLVTSIADARNLATAIFFLCCLVILFRCIMDFEAQRHPAAVLGALLLALPFAPAANVVVTVGFVVAERVLYMPSLGSVLLAAYGAQLLWGALFRHRPLLLAAGLLLLLLLCSRTLARNRDWASREALVRAGLKALPHNAKMHYNFANFQRDEGNMELATLHYKEALRLWPTYASAHNNLGTLMSATEDAERHFLAAIRFSPNHVNAHYNLGQVYRKENRTLDAVRMLERCVRLDAGYTPAYLLLSKLYSALGLRREVGRLLRLVAHLQPRSPDRRVELADWLLAQGRSWEALAQYERALGEEATHRGAMLGAARVLRAKGQRARLHQLMLRSLVMSRSHKGGMVYTGDLYNIKSWRVDPRYQQPKRNTVRAGEEEEPGEEGGMSEHCGHTSRTRLCDDAASTEAAEAARPGAAGAGPGPGPVPGAGPGAAATPAGGGTAPSGRRKSWLRAAPASSGPVNRTREQRAAAAAAAAAAATAVGAVAAAEATSGATPALQRSGRQEEGAEGGVEGEGDDEDEEDEEGRMLSTETGRVTGMGPAFYQGYRDAYWSEQQHRQQQQATSAAAAPRAGPGPGALHLPLAIGDQDMLCLAAAFPDPPAVPASTPAPAAPAAAPADPPPAPAPTEDDFATDFVTG